MKKIHAKLAFSYQLNARGDVRNIPAGWKGTVPDEVAENPENTEKLDLLEDVSADVVEPVKLSTLDISTALVETILPNLSKDELGRDFVPNVDVLKKKLAAHFECGVSNVPFKAKDRNLVWEMFTNDNPDFLAKFAPVKTTTNENASSNQSNADKGNEGAAGISQSDENASGNNSSDGSTGDLLSNSSEASAKTE